MLARTSRTSSFRWFARALGKPTAPSLCLTIPALKLAKIPQFCWISVADFDSRRDRNFQANFNFLLANRQFFKHGSPGQVIRGGTMYLRVVRAAGGKGVKHEYVRIVEAYRENGNKHRTIINLGRKDLLAAHLDL